MKKTAALLLTALTFTVASHGAIVYSDLFNYPNGPIVGASGSPWVQNTGTSGTMLVTNNELEVSTARTEDIATTLSGSPYRTNGAVAALYSSFTVRFIGLPNNAGTYFAHFTGETLSLHRARVWASTTNIATSTAAAPGNFLLGIGNSSAGNASSGQWPTELATNVTYTVVTRYQIATATSALWINPSTEGDTSVTATDFVDPTNLVNVVYYAFRQASGEGTARIDNLKVGTAFNDVAGANTSPTISAISPQSIPQGGSTGPIDFTVEDAETAAGALTVSAGSSNPVLIPTNNISFGGAGATRTVTLNPVAGQQGSATITITVSDGVNQTSTSFLLTVGMPSISAISNQITTVNQPVIGIPFTISDSESPAESLTVTATSSNPTLLPQSGIVLGGTAGSRTVSLTPQAAQTGVSTVTIFVSDGTLTNSTSFALTVSPVLGILFSDHFDYTEFTIPNALYGATGSPWQHASGTFYQLQVTNGAAELVFTNAEDLAVNLSGGPYAATAGVVFYFGFNLNLTTLPSSDGNYFLHLKDNATNTTFRAKVFASTTNAAAGSFRLGIANQASAVSAQFPQDLSLNQTNVVVVRYNSGTGETWLWVNPGNENSTHVAAHDTLSTAPVGAIGLRQDTGIGILDLDNLIVGTAFTNVVTVTQQPAAIPVHIEQLGNSVILSWTNPAFALQASPTLTGSFTNVTGATSPYTNSLSGSQLFFRLAF